MKIPSRREVYKNRATVGCLYTALRGRISSNRKPEKIVWQRSGGRVYVTCRACASINDISDFQIDTRGIVFPCVVCHHCQGHFGVSLLGWDGLSTYTCSACLTMKRSKTIPKGWVKSSFSTFCPKCESRILGRG